MGDLVGVEEMKFVLLVREDLFGEGSSVVAVAALRRLTGFEAEVAIAEAQEQPCSIKCARKVTAHLAFEDMS